MKVATLGAFFALNLLAAVALAQKCGQRRVSVRELIYGGYEAKAGDWPWHGAMFHRQKNGTFYACGVTILTEQFVITAAHCTFDSQDRQRLPEWRAYVKVGLTDLDSPERYVQQHNVADIIRHDTFKEDTLENDIALMKLNTAIAFNDYVQPICLWQGERNLKHVVSQIGHIVGWGYKQDYGLPKHLNEARMPILSRSECEDIDAEYCSKVYFEQKTFCAGFRNGTTAAPGDSGGGLFLQQGKSWALRGIVSNTKAKRESGMIDSKSFVVFTDVTFYLQWIEGFVTDMSAGPQTGPEPTLLLVAAVLVMFIVFVITLIYFIFCRKKFSFHRLRRHPETV